MFLHWQIFVFICVLKNLNQWSVTTTITNIIINIAIKMSIHENHFIPFTKFHVMQNMTLIGCLLYILNVDISSWVTNTECNVMAC